MALTGCATLGQSPNETDLARYAHSTQFDHERQRFVSPNQQDIESFGDTLFSAQHVLRALTQSKNTSPHTALPQQPLTKEALQRFYQNKAETQFIWLGHSTVLLSINSNIILIDPIFNHAGPVWFIGQRFQKSALTLKDLPYIDWVLISHDHYDHLEMSTIEALAESSTQFLVPLGVGRHLQKWGVKPQQIHEKDWWESIEIGTAYTTEKSLPNESAATLRITLTPAHHYSGRARFMQNDTLWASFVIEGISHRIFFSGDSGYGPHFAAIGNTFGPFDLVFIENGQYLDIAKPVHLLPEATLQAAQALSATHLVPIHWGAYALSLHPWCEPPTRLMALAQQQPSAPNLLLPMQGESIRLSGPNSLIRSHNDMALNHSPLKNMLPSDTLPNNALPNKTPLTAFSSFLQHQCD